MKKIVWSPLFSERLNQILNYIYNDDPYTATRILNEIEDILFLISNFPEIGKIAPHFEDLTTREMIIRGCYKLVYEVKKDSIRAILISHTRQFGIDNESFG